MRHGRSSRTKGPRIFIFSRDFLPVSPSHIITGACGQVDSCLTCPHVSAGLACRGELTLQVLEQCGPSCHQLCSTPPSSSQNPSWSDSLFHRRSSCQHPRKQPVREKTDHSSQSEHRDLHRISLHQTNPHKTKFCSFWLGNHSSSALNMTGDIFSITTEMPAWLLVVTMTTRTENILSLTPWDVMYECMVIGVNMQQRSADKGGESSRRSNFLPSACILSAGTEDLIVGPRFCWGLNIYARRL